MRTMVLFTCHLSLRSHWFYWFLRAKIDKKYEPKNKGNDFVFGIVPSLYSNQPLRESIAENGPVKLGIWNVYCQMCNVQSPSLTEPFISFLTALLYIQTTLDTRSLLLVVVCVQVFFTLKFLYFTQLHFQWFLLRKRGCLNVHNHSIIVKITKFVSIHYWQLLIKP